jgi:hypothetical protein
MNGNMTQIGLNATIFAALWMFVGTSAEAVKTASAKTEPVSVTLPSGAGPFRQPQFGVGDGQVGLAYGSDHTIYFSASEDGGRSFGPAVKVADVDALALGRHRGPRVTYWKRSIIISAVVGEHVDAGPHGHGLPADGNLTVWTSEDRGHTWARGAIVNDAPSAAREGLHSIAVDAAGNLFAVWLDLREGATQLYSSRSSDGGKHWSKNRLVYASPDGTICQCCDPSLVSNKAAAGGKGEIAIMWRNAMEGARDMYFSTTKDGFTFRKPQKLGTGTWKINACPMDGGGLAMFNDQVYSVWRRDGEVFLAQPGKPEQRIGAGKDVAVTATRAGVFTGWTTPEGVEVLPPGAAAPLNLGKGGFLNLTALADGSVLAAWEVDGTIQARRLTP